MSFANQIICIRSGLLGKGWPLGSRLWCLTVSLSLSNWYPGSGVVLDCIDSWSLHPYLLSSIKNTAHMALACLFRHHTSNLNWDMLNDSDFKAWVKYFGMPCSGTDTFTSSYTKPWSLVISLIDGYSKVSHAKSTWFAHLTRRDSHICLTTKSWRQINIRLYRNIPSTIKESIFLGASVIIITSSLLKRVDLSVDILSPSIWAKIKVLDVRG